MLRAVWGEPEHLGTAALRDYSERDIRDAGRLLRQLAGPLGELGAGDCVQLNDCVALRDAVDGTVEEFVVHAPGLVIRAPGYISADTALGTAVIGRRCGDVIRVETADGPEPTWSTGFDGRGSRRTLPDSPRRPPATRKREFRPYLGTSAAGVFQEL